MREDAQRDDSIGGDDADALILSQVAWFQSCEYISAAIALRPEESSCPAGTPTPPQGTQRDMRVGHHLADQAWWHKQGGAKATRPLSLLPFNNCWIRRRYRHRAQPACSCSM